MKISTKIIIACVALVALAAGTFLVTILVQRTRLRAKMEVLVQNQAVTEANKIVETLYLNCEATERRNQTRLAHSYQITRELVAQHGALSLGSQTVKWTAVNQLTRESQSLELPQMLLGTNWLGQNLVASVPSPLVDEVKHLTRDECTVFQRMNDQGDMLRICTSLVGTNGQRAIGTFISKTNPDGSPNPVLEKILRGEEYRGRAFVVNTYFNTAYEPIWDAEKKRVIGMVFTGVNLGGINKELHDAMTRVVVGKTGYVFVLGAKGENQGRYFVSQHGKRDGESIWETKDAAGHPMIQSIVGKALKTSSGSLTNEFYFWKNPGETEARMKFAAFTYFAPWDWVVGAGAYQDDYSDVIGAVGTSIAQLVNWTLLSALIVGGIGLVLSWLVARGITRPVLRIVEDLNQGAAQTSTAAAQVSSSSQSLASGASEQAASLEETSASMEELLAMTRRNAEHAARANELSRETCHAADQGVASMRLMNTSMESLQDSNQAVAKIIKTIDDIAFQTNLLALNAAVEAARAGEAGLGFAVVADEVRALSARSAEAAKETAEKIAATLAKTDQCAGLCKQTVTLLDRIGAHAHSLEEIAKQVSGASTEQSAGISQVNQAVSQLDQVTQTNAAASEESAAAAHQLNEQARAYTEAVTALRTLVTGKLEKQRRAPDHSVSDAAACFADLRKTSTSNRKPAKAAAFKAPQASRPQSNRPADVESSAAAAEFAKGF